LGNQLLGAIIAGQVADQYPESLLLERAAKIFGVSAQVLWRLSTNQRPVSRFALQQAGDLLCTLGQAFLRQRYGAILETHVAQSNLRFRLLVECVTDYALFTTDYLGRVTNWNLGAERMLGYPETKIVGQHFSRLFLPEDVQDGAPGKQLLKASQEGRSEDEGWRVRENRTRLWANVIITPLTEEVGSHRGFAVVMQDITDRRKAAIELETIRLERVSLQEQFLSHVSHELRTPLTAIYLFVTNLLDGVLGDLTPEQREHLEFSLQNVKQLKEMVSDLLDVSRIETLKLTVRPQHVSLPGLITEALNTCRANAESKNINLCADIAQGLPSAWADRARILQVLINLIDNGIKFTPNNGSVTVQGRIFPEDNNFLCISVVDTGCGISPGNCLIVFERLAQVKTFNEASRKGLGLGLFISRELVSRQGGRIWVDSRVGRGSSFSFTLPTFSLLKLCAPILTPANLAAGSVTLLSIGSAVSDGAIQAQDLAGIRKVLEGRILDGQDLLLPPMTDSELEESSFIIACPGVSGEKVLIDRLRKDLEASGFEPPITATTIQLPGNGEPWEKQTAEVTSKIEDFIQSHLHERENQR
jgi:PAS domain S-box-containing protein